MIAERVGRLAPEFRELLAVASVEGETFTAQVVAQVQGLGERETLRLLSRELEGRHRLVREDNLSRIGMAFLNMNAVISVVYLLTIVTALVVPRIWD